MKIYEVCWNEGLAGSIRQFSTTLKGVKKIKTIADERLGNQEKRSAHDDFITTKYLFKNSEQLVEWLNKNCRNNECCGDE